MRTTHTRFRAKSRNQTENLWTLAGGYDLVDNDDWRVQAFAGFRYIGAAASVDWELSGPLGRARQLGRAGWGARRCGAGDSNLTWQGIGVGYRYRSYKQDEDSPVQELTLGGPAFGRELPLLRAGCSRPRFGGFTG